MPAPESPSETSRGRYNTRSKFTKSKTPETSESDGSSGESSHNTSELLSGSSLSPDAVHAKVNARKMRTSSGEASSSITSEFTPPAINRRQTDKDGATGKIPPRPDLPSYRPIKAPLPADDNSSSTSSGDDDTEHFYAQGNRSSNANTEHFYAEGNRSSNAKVQQSGTSINSNLGNNFNLWLIIGVVCLAILFFFLLYRPTNSSNQNPISSGDKFRDFVGRIESVERKFSNQNSRLWRVVKASAHHVLNETEPRYPVVLLLATPASQATSSRCIAKRVSSEFEGVYGLNSNSLVVSNIDEWKNMDPAAQKKQLDEKLQTTFGDSRRKAVVIDNLQSLHPDAALMLHGYCDNDNAPFKDVMIVLLLNIDEGKVGRFTSRQVEDYLEQLWSRTLGTDKVKALLSRVANNIIIVDGEDQTKISSIC